jgi:ABC-type Mn2+/Zn2+ transport system ATPase subunit
MLSGLQVLAFDEPTLGQDDVYVASFVAKIRKLESIGHTILMISHDPRLSRFFFDARELIVEQNDIRMIEQ